MALSAGWTGEPKLPTIRAFFRKRAGNFAQAWMTTAGLTLSTLHVWRVRASDAPSTSNAIHSSKRPA